MVLKQPLHIFNGFWGDHHHWMFFGGLTIATNGFSMVFDFTTIAFNGFRWFRTIGQTMRWFRWIVVVYPVSSNSVLRMACLLLTQSRLMSWYESCKWVKVKVVKWCQKKWNEHNLMYICHKQCEIMHNIQRNSSNGQFHCFHYVR